MAQDGYLLKTLWYIFVFICVCVFNVWPKTTLLLPVWSRDAKRLDTPAPKGCRFYSQSGHTPRLQVPAQSGAYRRQPIDVSLSHGRFLFLSLFLPLSPRSMNTSSDKDFFKKLPQKDILWPTRKLSFVIPWASNWENHTSIPSLTLNHMSSPLLGYLCLHVWVTWAPRPTILYDTNNAGRCWRQPV